MDDDQPAQFPGAPASGRHVFAVCRFDGILEGSDPTAGFSLTRGYWTEQEAQQQAARLNVEAAASDKRYFVRPLRVADPSD